MREILGSNSFDEQQTALWTRGNFPSQKLLGLDPETTFLHLKALHLLADRIIGAASFYFESSITRNIIDQQAALLVERGDLALYVNEEYGSFRDHGLNKFSKNSNALQAYRDRQFVISAGLNLDKRVTRVERPSSDLSRQIEALWIADLDSVLPGSLGTIAAQVDRHLGSEFPIAKQVLETVGHERQGDLIWEVIEPKLQIAGFPDFSLHACRVRLLHFYNLACSSIIRSTPDVSNGNSRALVESEVSPFDTGLFVRCLDSLGILEQFGRLTMAEVVSLKESAGWRVFHGVYVHLLLLASDGSLVSDVAVVRELSEFMMSKRSAGMSRSQFVRTFEQMAQLTGLDTLADKGDLADRFHRVGETFGETPFVLLQRAMEVVRQKSQGLTIHPSNGKGTKMNQLKAFIVHGSDMATVYELKDYLQNVLGMHEPIVLAQKPNAGRTIIEKFETEASAIDVVFVLLTPDDPAQSGRQQPRQNVLFELGYFVAKFGRSAGRVILLKKGDVEIASDLAGVVYINIERDIAGAGEDIRRELADLP